MDERESGRDPTHESRRVSDPGTEGSLYVKDLPERLNLPDTQRGTVSWFRGALYYLSVKIAGTGIGLHKSSFQVFRETF